MKRERWRRLSRREFLSVPNVLDDDDPEKKIDEAIAAENAVGIASLRGA